MEELRLDYADLKYPPSPKVVEALKKSLNSINEYPDENYLNIRKAIAKKTGFPLDWIITSNGLDEMIDIITRAFCRENESVVIPVPTFSQFSLAAKRQRVRSITIDCLENNKFVVSAKKIQDNIKKDTRIIWLCSPNNPTGTLIAKKDICDIAKKNDCLIVIDEALADFSGITNQELTKKFPNIIVMRSLSKSYSLAGMRIGYAIGNPKTLGKVAAIKQIFNVNKLAEVAAVAALKDNAYYAKIWAEFQDAKKDLLGGLKFLGIKVVGGEANILLMDFETEKESKRVFERLLEQGIRVFPGWDPEFTGLQGRFLRIVVGLPKHNKRLLETLQKIIEVKS